MDVSVVSTFHIMRSVANDANANAECMYTSQRDEI